MAPLQNFVELFAGSEALPQLMQLLSEVAQLPVFPSQAQLAGAACVTLRGLLFADLQAGNPLDMCVGALAWSSPAFPDGLTFLSSVEGRLPECAPQVL